MGKNQSRPDAAAIRQAARDAAKAEELAKRQEQEMKHREEMLQQQLRQANQMQEERVRRLEADRAENKQINEKLMLKLHENEERAKAEQQNQLKMFQATMQDHMKMLTDLVKLAQEDPDKAEEQALEWQAKVEALEKEREDWAAAEKAKSEKLMRESPPPTALMKNPPKTEPLFTETYPCFAVMGKAGTGKSSLINAIAKREACKVSAEGEVQGVIEGNPEPPPVFVDLPNGVNAAFFDRPGVGAAHGGGDQYVQDQGLKWWTGVIVVVDSRVCPEDATLNRVCQAIKTPVIVVRNKFEHDLKDEIDNAEKATATFGQRVDEVSFRAGCLSYLRHPKIGIEQPHLVDTKFPEKHDFHKLLSWLEQHSKKTSK